MKGSVLLVVIMFPVLSFAREKKKGVSRLYPSYAVQYFYDKNGIKYDGNPPEGHIHPQNTIGHNLGLTYERVTRYGLVIDAGLQYGIRKYDISIRQDMSNFDSSAVNDLKGVFYTDRTALAVNYWGYKFMMGYSKQLPKNMAIVGKGGVGIKLFYNGSWEYREDFIDYTDDNGYTSHSAEVTDIQKQFGRDPSVKKSGFLGSGLFPDGMLSYELYIGIEKAINRYIVRNISVGLEGSRSCFMWSREGDMIIWTSPSISHLMASRETFFDRNISLGLRVAVGLW